MHTVAYQKHRIRAKVYMDEMDKGGRHRALALLRTRKAAAMRYDKVSKPFYHTAEWKRLRKLALARDGGMCCDCMDRFRLGTGKHPNRATVVHHVIPLEERPDLALRLDNLRSLCDACHNKRHPEKGRGEQVRHTSPTTMRIIKV